MNNIVLTRCYLLIFSNYEIGTDRKAETWARTSSRYLEVLVRVEWAKLRLGESMKSPNASPIPTLNFIELMTWSNFRNTSTFADFRPPGTGSAPEIWSGKSYSFWRRKENLCSDNVYIFEMDNSHAKLHYQIWMHVLIPAHQVDKARADSLPGKTDGLHTGISLKGENIHLHYRWILSFLRCRCSQKLEIYGYG